MKHINFIDQHSLEKQKNIQTWFRYSIISILAIIILLASYNGYQIYAYMTEKNDIAIIRQTKLPTIEKLELRLRHINKQLEQLRMKKKVLKKYSSQNNQPYYLLKTMTTSMPSSIALNDYIYEKGGVITLHGIGLTRKAITDFIQKLKDSSVFTGVNLTSLQQNSTIVHHDNTKTCAFIISLKSTKYT